MSSAFMNGFADELSKEAGLKDLQAAASLGLSRVGKAVSKGGGTAKDAIIRAADTARKVGRESKVGKKWDSLSGDQKAYAAGGGAFVGEKVQDEAVGLLDDDGIAWENLSNEEKDLVSSERVRGKKSKSKEGLKKEALVGIGTDAMSLGIPSAIGYMIGKNTGRGMAEDDEKRPSFGIGSAAALALIPGASGYMIGKRRGYDSKKKANKRRRDSAEKKSKS
jgi:hypothetical protein